MKAGHSILRQLLPLLGLSVMMGYPTMIDVETTRSKPGVTGSPKRLQRRKRRNFFVYSKKG
jgi:hypothetical protein